MNFLSSIFVSGPTWHRELPAHLKYRNKSLVADLETLRTTYGLNDQDFTMILVQSKSVMLRNVQGVYRDAQLRFPGHSDHDHLMMVLGTRISGKLNNHFLNTSPTAVPVEELLGILEDVSKVVLSSWMFSDVFNYLCDIENREGRFEQPFVSCVDAVCDRHQIR